MKVLAKHKTAFERQVTEAVLIEISDDGRLLNSKGEFNRCVLPRLQVAVGEKVAEDGVENRKEGTNFDGILTARKDNPKRKYRSDAEELGKDLEKNMNVKKDPERQETKTEASFTSNSVRKLIKPKKSKNKISPPQNYNFIPLSRRFEKTDYEPGIFGSNDRGSNNRDKRPPAPV